MDMGQSGMHMGSLYGYIHVGHSIRVWAEYAYELLEHGLHSEEDKRSSTLIYCTSLYKSPGIYFL